MGRAPCCDKDGLKKGPWTAEEDQKLIDYIQKQGSGNWRTLPKNAGLQRCGKSCRLRWINYLRPDIKRGRFSVEEEETMIQMHGVLGNKWSAIAARLPGRTDNEIKNYWNTRIRKRLLRMGIDPVTHAPRLDLLNISTILNASNRINIHNMLGGEPTLVNPEILRIASVLYSQQRDTNYVFQDQSQYQQPPWIKSELHGQEVDQVAGGCVSFTNEATTMQQQQQQPCNGEEDYNYVPNLTNNYDDSYYFVPEQDHFLNPLSESSYPTVLSSTPSSSISTPIHSTSTFTNGGGGGGGEDERESYSSQYSLNDESIADFLDMDSSWNDIQQLLAGQSEFPAVPC